MRFLAKLFKKDPDAIAAKVEGALDRGAPYRALEIAEGFARSADDSQEERAGALVRKAREALVESILRRSDEAEAEGDLADAADWIGAALERLDDGDPRHLELEERLDDIRERIEVAEGEAWAERAAGGSVRSERAAGTDVDVESHYRALVDMLVPGIAARYEDRPKRFREAVVALNEGRLEEAVADLGALLEEDPDDPVLRFERGRCRLLNGDPEGARSDFDAAWDELGDDPLDLSGATSVPALWADASLAAGEPEAVLERLGPPAEDRYHLVERYGAALVEAGRTGEARDYLGRAASRHPERQSLPYLLARSLRADGEAELARECLETAVAPTCTTGRCGGRKRHLPSLRLLAELHLEGGSDPERAFELLTFVVRDQGGARTVRDLELLSRYHERTGDLEAAEGIAAEAERLATSDEDLAFEGEGPPDLVGGRRSVL